MLMKGDEDLLHRAIYNLLLNAVQARRQTVRFASRAGSWRSSASAGRPEFERGGIAVLCRAIAGPGSSPEIRDRLFDPFVTNKPGGSGLGLSIVQRAAEAHGGFVIVSAPGEETRFTLVTTRDSGDPVPK